jgi:hypothetical protein
MEKSLNFVSSCIRIRRLLSFHMFWRLMSLRAKMPLLSYVLVWRIGLERKLRLRVDGMVCICVKQIYQRQRKRINEARLAKGETAKPGTAPSTESSKAEKKAEGDEIIAPEGAPSSTPGEGDRARASKTQDHAEKSAPSEDVPKTLGRVSTMTTSTPAATSITLNDT